MSYRRNNENRFIKETSQSRRQLDKIIDNTVKNVNRVCNYTKSGKVNNAPLFSKRGHVAESTAAYSLLANCCVEGVDMSRIGVATDEMCFNLNKIKKNDQFRDVVVKNLSNNIENSYQAKVYSSSDKSIAAATQKKYIDKGVRPYVPKDQSDLYGNIDINIDGKTIKSDDYTLNDLNEITDQYSKGKFINPFKDNKTKKLYLKSIKKGVSESVKSAFMCSAIKEITDYLCGKEITQENSIQTLSSLVTSTIDGCVRSYIRQDAGFKSYGNMKSVALAEIGYDSTIELVNYALGNSTGEEMITSGLRKVGSNLGSAATSSLMSHLGVSLGSPFGTIGSIVGCKIGQATGIFLGDMISKYSNKSKKEIGESIAIQNAYSRAYGGIEDSLTVSSNYLIESMMPLVNAAQAAVGVIDTGLTAVENLVVNFVTYRNLKKLNKEVSSIKSNINHSYADLVNDYKKVGADTLSYALNSSLKQAYQKNILQFNEAMKKPITELVDVQNEFQKLNIDNEERQKFTQEFFEYVKSSEEVSIDMLNDLIENYEYHSYDDLGMDEFISIREIKSLLEGRN